jgi:UDP-3-O-[3-hydroxymyristoyl] N-acetylglucosamine deacetylase
MIVEGIGLHTGTRARVELRLCPGPVRFCPRGGALVPLDELVIVSSDRATTVESTRAGLRIRTVEHALAALGGLGVYEGVIIGVEGPEMPVLDGGAATWCQALRQLGASPSRPGARGRSRLVVERPGVFCVGSSRFEFTPGPGVEIEVRLEGFDPRISPDARWGGDPDEFEARIAPARTFAFAHEVDDLLGRGLAQYVDPASVVLITPEAIHHAGMPFAPDEPARHKLLDLVGDLHLHGGPPIGRVRAVRPGHAANARAIRQALDAGVVVQSG